MYLSKFDDQSSEEISVNVTGKMIVQKNISKIPLKLSYICGTIKEQVKNIYDSKIVDTDLLKIGIMVLSISLDTFYSNKNYAARKI